jgi:hypothetical protein
MEEELPEFRKAHARGHYPRRERTHATAQMRSGKLRRHVLRGSCETSERAAYPQVARNFPVEQDAHL